MSASIDTSTLKDLQSEIEAHARSYGLDFFPVVFEVLSYDQINEVAAYGGFPTRYPHWRHGMEFEYLKKGYAYGLQKIYEMVINNNPSYAYLLASNPVVDQKLVMAHVYGHVDFFKNNQWFAHTNRKMMDEMANHATRIRRSMERFGVDAVEEFIDRCLSLENLIDPHSVAIRRRHGLPDQPPEAEIVRSAPKLKSKEYLDRFMNPPAHLEKQRQKIQEERRKKRKHPESPDRDVLGFLLEDAPLDPWQQDVLSIVRDEAYYFLPQIQTKIMNEGWACLAPESLVFTNAGLVSMRTVLEEEIPVVFDGETKRRVYARNIIRGHDRVSIRTRRGFEVCGSNNHRVMLADGRTWKRLDDLVAGDRMAVSGGGGLWPETPVALEWVPPRRVGLDTVARSAGVSLWTVLRFRAGRRIRQVAAVAHALEAYDAPSNSALPQAVNQRAPIRIPRSMDEPMAAFLGYLVGDGHISRVKRNLGLTTGDGAQAVRFLRLARDLFGLVGMTRRDGGRWRVLLYSETLADFLTQALGLTSGPSAREKRVPVSVLRSPEPVVRAFLRAYFDCDAYAGDQGVILSTMSQMLSKQVQLLLLNYGILSRRRVQTDGCWHVHVSGASAARFAEKVGFNLRRKQEALERSIRAHRWFTEETWEDEVVSIERDRGDVYDISVADTHRYAACGLIHHNSYWHSTIMTRKCLTDAEVVDYADHFSGTLGVRPGSINPYKLGLELYRDIEERWDKGRFGKEWEDCDDLAARHNWDKGSGLGKQKIFEVRRIYNDLTFVDTFLTPEFAARMKLFTYGYNSQTGEYVIQDRQFRKIKDRLLASLTNAGNPIIAVEDANHANRGELLLAHQHEGEDLDIARARETLRALHALWKRPVHLKTALAGAPKLVSFDGTDFKEGT